MMNGLVLNMTLTTITHNLCILLDAIYKLWFSLKYEKANIIYLAFSSNGLHLRYKRVNIPMPHIS